MRTATQVAFAIFLIALAQLIPAVGVTAATTTSASTTAAHTCNGSEQYVAQTYGARVCFYPDTNSFKICDNAADGHHPAVHYFGRDVNNRFHAGTYHEYPTANRCGSEAWFYDPSTLEFRAEVWEGHAELIGNSSWKSVAF